MDRIFAKLLYMLEKKLPTVLVTIIADRGSAPRGAGSQMLVGEEGRILGTIGGGAVEGKADAMARQLLKEQRSCCHLFQLHTAAQDHIGMVCGGDVQVQFQYIPGMSAVWESVAGKVLEMTSARQTGWLALKTNGSSPSVLTGEGKAVLGEPVSGNNDAEGWKPMQNKEVFCIPLPIGERAIIFGGGHCAQALAPLLHTVGFRVTVFEEREEYGCRKNFPTAEQIIVGDYTKISERLQITSEDYIVIMTNGHSFDLEVQDQVLRGDFAYVGVIGSKKKTAAVNQKLRERGISEEAISRVHTPIGTSIKAVTPEEIGISIAGELIYTRALRREETGIVATGCPMH
ncbi:MAG: xanthine dehydrogenase accessory protein XdhC [Oscillospiraceae bacterium]|nr:xanthine dehydrogenase accessory protein XdhC [Oscillospiraceae bacterium]